MTDNEKRKIGLGHNLSKEETDYKSLFENFIAMVLEPKINIDTYLKDSLERARTATRLADKFEALHHAEETRAMYEDRLNTLEHFKQCKGYDQRPHKHMWAKLQSQWGTPLFNYYQSRVKNNTYEFGKSWRDEVSYDNS